MSESGDVYGNQRGFLYEEEHEAILAHERLEEEDLVSELLAVTDKLLGALDMLRYLDQRLTELEKR